MAFRKRHAKIPDNLQTNEEFKSKNDLDDRNSRAIAHPPAPVKIRPRKSLLGHSKNERRVVIVGNQGSLSDIYQPSIALTYLDQVFIRCGQLGEGSFGQVFRVKERTTGSYYALKKIKPNVSYQQYFNEISNNEQVGVHENIVRYFMSWEEGPNLNLLFEYCDLSLEVFASKVGHLSEDVLWYLICDIAKALTYIHGKKFVHMDVKPSNILLKESSFKLGDFGLLYNYDSPKAPIISDGDSKYLADEVLKCVYLPYADVFSLGISVLELVSNTCLPDQGILWQQLRHEIFPKVFTQAASRGLHVIVSHMMRYNYMSRPSSEMLLKYPGVREIVQRDKREGRPNFLDLLPMNQYGPGSNLGYELDLLEIYKNQRSLGGNNNKGAEGSRKTDSFSFRSRVLETPHTSSKRSIKCEPKFKLKCSRNIMRNLMETSDDESDGDIQPLPL